MRQIAEGDLELPDSPACKSGLRLQACTTLPGLYCAVDQTQGLLHAMQALYPLTSVHFKENVPHDLCSDFLLATSV